MFYSGFAGQVRNWTGLNLLVPWIVSTFRSILGITHTLNLLFLIFMKWYSCCLTYQYRRLLLSHFKWLKFHGHFLTCIQHHLSLGSILSKFWYDLDKGRTHTAKKIRSARVPYQFIYYVSPGTTLQIRLKRTYSTLHCIFCIHKDHRLRYFARHFSFRQM